MENINSQCCLGLPMFCSAGKQASKSIHKPEVNPIGTIKSEKTETKQQPWSVFGDLYWI